MKSTFLCNLWSLVNLHNVEKVFGRLFDLGGL